jgi:CHAD domain-containing protein
MTTLSSTHAKDSRDGSGSDQGERSCSLDDLLATRLRKFLAQLPRVLSEENAEAVHDLRVWSRRLQQVVAALFPQPHSSQAQTMVRAIRRARRAVARWRDCDVLIGMVQRRLKRVRQTDERCAWEVVYRYLLARRERAISRARRRLANRRLFNLAQSLKGLTQNNASAPAAHTSHDHLGTLMGSVIKDSYALWQEALSRASESLDLAEVHAFRIQTKRLRYQLELARDLGAQQVKPALAWLHHLQDVLGNLHDRGELARMAAKALADPDFLLAQPRAASRLLSKLAAQRNAERAETQELLDRVSSASELPVLEGLIEQRPYRLGTGEHVSRSSVV